MNAAEITALITAITAAIGAFTTLAVLIMHIIRHQPLPGDTTSSTTVHPGLVNPSPADGSTPHKP